MRTHPIVAPMLACAAVLISSSAFAQDIGEVTVKAKRVITATVTGRSATGVPITSYSVSYGVKTADLDLTNPKGSDELMQRINDAALAACKDIGRQYPNAQPSDDECAKAAAKPAIAQAHTMIRAVSKAGTK